MTLAKSIRLMFPWSVQTLVTPLELVSKKSPKEGSLPVERKRTNVVPLFKKEDREIAINY